MMLEKRKSERRLVSRYAKLQLVDGSLPRDCLITDLSEGGVRLHIEGMDVPQYFRLLISSDDNRPEVRNCEVVWKLGYELGAKFNTTRGVA